MFHMNQNLKIVLAMEPVDLRKSFNGLYTIARNELSEMPEDGAMFIFSNRAKTRIKVLCFDGTGCWVSVKRLEQGTFSWPKGVSGGMKCIDLWRFEMLLSSPCSSSLFLI